MSETRAEPVGAALRRITRATRRAEAAAYGIRGRADYAGIRLVALQERLHPTAQLPLTFTQRVRLFESGTIR